MSQPIVEVLDLVKHFPGVKAVDGVSFGIREGSCFGLLGPNGAGKTTTIEIMEGILSPTDGQVLYKGQPIGTQFKQEAGIQFQSTSLQEFLTVRETLRLFQRLYARASEIDALVETCALSEFLDRDNRKLSGGQRQRLLLAIALVNDPQIVFLDEPTTGLDPQSRRNFWTLIENIKAQRKTVLLTTHYMEEAAQLCDEIAIMDHGQVIAQGAPRDLLEAHFNDILIELPEHDFNLSGTHPAWQIHSAAGKVVIHTDDVHGTIRFLHDQNVNLAHMTVRSRTLEDLFLELTGKELRG